MLVIGEGGPRLEISMRAVPATFLLLVCVIGAPVAAFAQDAVLPMEAPRHWEVELTTQFMPGASILLESLNENERVIGKSGSLGVGHFFTPHLRAFASVGTRRNDGMTRSVITETSEARHYQLYDPKGAVFTSSLTWQFRENAMVHPFVSAGLNIGSYHYEERVDHVTGSTYRFELLTQGDRAEVRPVFGLGAKTYFSNGRWYMRPEVALAIGSTGGKRVLVRIGLGLDF